MKYEFFIDEDGDFINMNQVMYIEPEAYCIDGRCSVRFYVHLKDLEPVATKHVKDLDKEYLCNERLFYIFFDRFVKSISK